MVLVVDRDDSDSECCCDEDTKQVMSVDCRSCYDDHGTIECDPMHDG